MLHRSGFVWRLPSAIVAAALLHAAGAYGQASGIHQHTQEGRETPHAHDPQHRAPRGADDVHARPSADDVQAPAHDVHSHAHTDSEPRFPPPTSEDLEAAFPDLGDMDIRSITHDDPLNFLVLVDRLEVKDTDPDSAASWNAKAWLGRDLEKLWLRTEGERRSSRTERADLELLYGRAFNPWWDWVAGVRHDFAPGSSRTWAAFGVQGLAPYRFEIEVTAYIGQAGRTAARLEVDYELLMTNRLILQPLLELEWHGKDDIARGVGSGLGRAEAGMRLRYEVRREVAPYVGIVLERRLGTTADLARVAGHAARDTSVVAGIRLWF